MSTVILRSMILEYTKRGLKMTKQTGQWEQSSQHTGTARRKGSITIVTAAGLIGLLGFCALAADYGTSIVIKNKLQRLCDGAALAGATELKRSNHDATDFANARYQARLAAYNNGVTIADSDITFPANNRIRVVASQQRNFLFGKAIGIPTGVVGAAAIAGRDYVRALTGAVPLGITAATYFNFRPTAGNSTPKEVELRLTRNTSEKFGPLNADGITGNTVFDVVALDLRYGSSGNSGALFEEELANSTQEKTVLTQQIDPLGSSVNSQGQKIENAINDRIARAAGAPWFDTGVNYTYPNYPANDPRVVFILVGADGYAANNSNPKLNLAYFVPAYITGPVTKSKGSNAQALLHLRLLPSTGLSSMTRGVEIEASGNDTGLTVTRLLG